MANPGKGVLGEIAGAVGRGVKNMRDARKLKKIKYSPAATAARVKGTSDATLAAKEVDDAIKFAKRNRTILAAAAGAGATYLGGKAANKKVTVTVSDRKKPAAPKKKTTKKKKLPKGTARYSF
jgi:hypothetical protein